MSEGYRVAVVDAIGQAGTSMLRLLRERHVPRAPPARELLPFASCRSASKP